MAPEGGTRLTRLSHSGSLRHRSVCSRCSTSADWSHLTARLLLQLPVLPWASSHAHPWSWFQSPANQSSPCHPPRLQREWAEGQVSPGRHPGGQNGLDNLQGVIQRSLKQEPCSQAVPPPSSNNFVSGTRQVPSLPCKPLQQSWLEVVPIQAAPQAGMTSVCLWLTSWAWAQVSTLRQQPFLSLICPLITEVCGRAEGTWVW